MRTTVFASILVLFLTSLTAPWVTTARAMGPFASGNYRFVLEDDLTKSFEFDARSDERGTITGHMTFTDEATILEQDVDGAGDPPREEPPPFSMQADLDSLTIEGNRALMSGTIRDSNRPGYIGKWIQLIVEDNGDGRERSDKFIWRLCQPEADGWTPRDAEDPRDEGAWWHWWATDSERRDDAGVPSRNIIPDRSRRCEALPLSSYELDEVKSGEGQIQVQP
jgi:hypothetical protein